MAKRQPVSTLSADTIAILRKSETLMKTLKKLLAAGLCAAVTIPFLAGCSSDSPTGNGDAKKLKIGIVQYATHPSLDNCYDGLMQGLKDAEYTEDKVSFKLENAQGKTEVADQAARNMAAGNYDLLIGIATPAAISAYSAARATDIPVVFCAASDPVTPGLVKSLDKPENNCTGTADQINLEGQLKMIRAFQPQAKKIGIIYSADEPNSLAQLKKIKELAPAYGFEIVASSITKEEQLAQVAADLVTKVDCLNNFTDNKVVDNLQILLQKANEKKIPVYGSEVTQVEAGCLASESIDYVALGKATGKLAAEILEGKSAADTPVVQFAESTPVVNPDVAGALGLSIPADYASAEKIASK